MLDMFVRRSVDFSKVAKPDYDTDRVMCVGCYKTLRIKTPTVDIICKNRKLCAIDVARKLEYRDAHPAMSEDSV